VRILLLKYLILVGDGMADYPLPDLEGRTPLEAANIPAMDEIARIGASGMFWPIPDGLPAGSDIGNLSLFGYDPHETFTGRAPLEAANQGITLKPDQIAFRCNLVTLQDHIMHDFTSGHISSEEAAQLIADLDSQLVRFSAHFSPGVSYRHLIIITADQDVLSDLQDLSCTPPHDITGRPVADYLPKGKGSEQLLELMEASWPVLADHPVNCARIDAGKPAATSIWLWGQGRTPSMSSYRERFDLSGAVISAVDLIRGIGVCSGLEVVNVPGATGYLDTNYEGKVSAALEALDRLDFVYLHVEAPDETSHEGRIDLKIRAIEEFDSKVVSPCFEHVRAKGDCRLLVAPDHVTSIQTRTHAGGPVPFALCGAGVPPDRVTAFSERAADLSGIRLTKGHTLVCHMLRTPLVDLAALNRLNK